MSFEDTKCPCGGVKNRDSMLCHDCEHHLANVREMAVYKDESYPVQSRRNAAIGLLSLARRRKTQALPKS